MSMGRQRPIDSPTISSWVLLFVGKAMTGSISYECAIASVQRNHTALRPVQWFGLRKLVSTAEKALESIITNLYL